MFTIKGLNYVDVLNEFLTQIFIRKKLKIINEKYIERQNTCKNMFAHLFASDDQRNIFYSVGIVARVT